MNDERINLHLSKIKRNNVYMLAIVSIIPFAIRLINGASLADMWVESTVLSISVLSIIVANVYQLFETVKDERVTANVLRIYDIGFSITIILGFLGYFLSILYSWFPASSASYLNLILFLMFLISYINIRKNNMTFNHGFIEADRKAYVRGVAKRVFYLFLFAVAYGFIILALGWKNDLLPLVEAAVLGSFFNISLLYVLFSIFERIRYQERLEVETGTRRYISRNAFFLVLITSLFSLYFAIIVILTNSLQAELWNPNDVVQLLLMAAYVSNNLRSLDMSILVLITNLIIFYSISKLKLHFPPYFKYFKVIIWLGFACSVISAIYTNITPLIVYLLDYEVIQKIMLINQYYGFIMTLISWGVSVLILIFMIQNSFTVVRLYIIRFVLAVLLFVLSLNMMRLLGGNMSIAMKVFIANSFSVIIGFVIDVFLLVIVFRLSRQTQQFEVQSEEEISNPESSIEYQQEMVSN